jgi:hypothetical protein
MSLDLLNKYDERTAEGILAAAALSTGYFATDHDQPQILKRFSREAQDLLEEVRSKLKIERSDRSSSAISSIDKYLAKEISNRVLPGSVAQEALTRAGQAGRAPPTLYSVLQDKSFLNRFLALGVRQSHVEDAVKHPDEYQHLLNDLQPLGNKDTISLFMKEVVSKNKQPHWLLVQTVRQGLVQNVQSAWRVFPSVIDLSKAQAPIDVLKALANRFGMPVQAADRQALFVESISLSAAQARDFKFKVRPNDPDVFFSFSFSADPEGQTEVGIAYCMDLRRYKRYLVENGALR